MAVIQGLSRELAQTASTARPPGRKHAGDLAGARCHLGNEHEPEAAEDGVDSAVVQREVGGVLDREPHVREPERSRAAAGDLDHLGGGVGREELTARQQAGKRAEPGLTRPCRELQEQLPRARLEQLDHPGREKRRRPREQAPPPLPARRNAPPGVDLLRRYVVYAVTPLNWGMMCSPYAASVSSWPWVIR